MYVNIFRRLAYASTLKAKTKTNKKLENENKQAHVFTYGTYVCK